MYTPQNFRDEVIGKRFDIDGQFGSQCWDGYAYYMTKLGYPYANCTTSGFVIDIWNNRNNNGMLKNCSVVTIMQQGDIVVFNRAPSTPYSHIAIFMKDNKNGSGVFLGQNQGGINGAFNETTLPYANIAGSFRPNVFSTLYAKPTYVEPSLTVLNVIPGDFRYEKAIFTCSVDKLNIRRAPSLKGLLTGDYYQKGMAVNYDGYVRREGYVWISWIGKDNTRRWMAAGELNAQNVNVKPYGIFK